MDDYLKKIYIPLKNTTLHVNFLLVYFSIFKLGTQLLKS